MAMCLKWICQVFMCLILMDTTIIAAPPEKQQVQFHKIDPNVAQANKLVGLIGKRSLRKRKTFTKTIEQLPTAAPRVPQWMKDNVILDPINKRYGYKSSVEGKYIVPLIPSPTVGAPWPRPQVYSTTSRIYHIKSSEFKFRIIKYSCDILDFAIKRIQNNVFPSNITSQRNNWSALGVSREINSVNITVRRPCDRYPHLEANESYRLKVGNKGLSLEAEEIWGALWGLETLSQLIYQDYSGTLLINKTYIEDFPRFPHRGVMLDTARHFVRKETIILNLEAMAQNKMNVFHWHIVDEQSFPFQSKTFPELSEKGAYDPVEAIYTAADVQEIIEEARLRGIRVVPEFDTPGHMASWGFGTDNLLTPCYKGKEPEGFYGPVNPVLESTYKFLEKFYGEVLSVFPDKYVHLGGDEIPFDCWKNNPQILEVMKKFNLSEMKALLAYYENRLIKIIERLSEEKKNTSGYIMWQDALENDINVNVNAIVQIWIGANEDIRKYVDKGHRVIFSSCWYLNMVNYGMDWNKYYQCDNLDQTYSNMTLLLGGEAALWTEYIADNEVIPKLWPRTSAVAERLWSEKHVNIWEEATPRIEEQRCRMLRRGLNVDALSGPGYCKHTRLLRRHPMYERIWSLRDVSSFSFNNFEARSVANHAIYGLTFILLTTAVLLMWFILSRSKGSRPVILAAVYTVQRVSKLRKHKMIHAAVILIILVCVFYNLT